MDKKKWYVVKVISGRELKVKDSIEKEVVQQGLSDYLGQILIPIEKVIHIRKGKKYQREKVYFPGYIMIEAELIGELIHLIKRTIGVINFLTSSKGGAPINMRDDEVDRLLGKVDELIENINNNATINYNVGDSVKVIDGPFNGFIGSVDRVIEDKRKLEVMVLIFGRKTPLELNFNQVEKNM